MLKKIIIAAVVIIVVVLGFFLLQNPTGQVTATQSKTIKIGAILPLTGGVANVGQNSKAAVELAVEQVNSEGGINGKKLEVVFEDGQCEAKATTSAAQKLTNVDNIVAAVGGLCSAETLAAAPVFEKSRKVLLSNCSSNSAITNSGDFIFRNYPSDNFQGMISARFAFNELKAQKIAVLYCLSDWCTGLKQVFQQEFENLGGRIVASEEFAQGSTDLRTQLLKIKESEADLIYFLAYTQEAIIGIKQARELGINAKILGADAMADSVVWNTLGKTGNGVLFTSIFTPENKEFKAKLAERMGPNSDALCASQAFDAVKILASALKTCGENSECVKNELYKVKNYQGVSGIIGFDSKGDLLKASYAINEVKDEKPEVLKVID